MSRPFKPPELPDTRYGLAGTPLDPLVGQYYLVRERTGLSGAHIPDLRFYELGFSSGKVRVIGRDDADLPFKDALQLGDLDTIEEAWAAILLHNSTRI